MRAFLEIAKQIRIAITMILNHETNTFDKTTRYKFASQPSLVTRGREWEREIERNNWGGWSELNDTRF